MFATSSSSDEIILLAGEQSGDNHAAKLMKALQTLRPSLRFVGVGGPQMRAAGLHCLIPQEKLSTMGFTQVLRRIFELLGYLSQLRREIVQRKPLAVISVDFPDFHFHLARMTRKAGYKGPWIHYISPSLWAWRKGRAKSISRLVDKVLCIFPFEPAYYPEGKALFVGNPSAAEFSPEEKRPGVAIFPGSRPGVVAHNLPLQLSAARLLGLPITISVANSACRAIIEPLAAGATLVSDSHRSYEHAIATSGTIVLELALAGTPTVCTYCVSKLNMWVGEHIFGIQKQFFCLPNILLGREIVPELIGAQITAEEIVSHMGRVTAAKELTKILTSGYKNPSLQAAEAVLTCVSKI